MGKDFVPHHMEATQESYYLYKGILTMVEFVAVPQIFDIEHFLTMRETTGFIDIADKKQLKIVSDAVKNSTVFAIVNNPNISIVTIFAFLQILKELNLVIQIATNPLMTRLEDYDYVAAAYADPGNQDAKKPATIVFINLLMLQQEGLLDKALESVVKIDEYFDDINETIKKIGKLD